MTDGLGAVLTGQDVRWNSLNPAVVSVSQTGLVHGVAVGTAAVSAIIGEHVAIDSISVFAPPPIP